MQTPLYKHLTIYNIGQMIDRAQCIDGQQYLALLVDLRDDLDADGSTRRDLLWQVLSVLHMSVWRKGKKPVLGRFRGPT